MDVMAGLAAASQAIEIAKTLRQVGRDYDAVALKGRIIDLTDKLIDVKGSFQEIKETIEDKDREIQRLKEAARVRAATVERGGMRYPISKDGAGEPQGRPFCSRCDQVDGLMITTADNGRGVVCPQCKSAFGGARQFFWDSDPRS